MKNSNIKTINTAGLIGYIVSIILIICSITGMVFVGICTVGAFSISNNEINVKMATNININSTGNFLNKLNSFISIDGIEDFSTLTEDAKDGIKVNDENISELSVKEENGGLNINAKTNEINISMKKIIVALIAAFIFLGAVTVSLYMVKALMKSLKNCETPFSEDVIKKMSRFAISLVCVVVLHSIFSGFWSTLTSGLNYSPSINFGSVLLVAVIYILITVFKYGAKLQQESDETL